MDELERLQKLSQAQAKLLKGMGRLTDALPMAISDVVPDYEQLTEEIETLTQAKPKLPPGMVASPNQSEALKAFLRDDDFTASGDLSYPPRVMLKPDEKIRLRTGDLKSDIENYTFATEDEAIDYIKTLLSEELVPEGVDIVNPDGTLGRQIDISYLIHFTEIAPERATKHSDYVNDLDP